MSPPATPTAPPLYSLYPACQTPFFHHHHSRSLSLSHNLPGSGSSSYDPELRSVLELATDSELYELERILFGPSYFSPMLKSITKRADVDHIMIGEDPEEREDFISMLESRFLYLAADARSTLRGWRPSYRNVLLGIRKKLNIPCSAKLSAEDLEVEIFLHLLQEYSSEEPGSSSSSKGSSKNSDGSNNLELGLSQWKVQKLAALGIGAADLRSMVLKLGGRLSGKMITEAAKYQMKKELIRKGLKAAATRYLGLRSMSQLLGPMMWGTLLADVVIQMLGTDYARILRAVYAFAQIRIYRSHKTASDVM
ncbi:hypothetical protein Sango_1644400 [Sesamum angolense]|uniref:Uncharacterized protein n=1 Tax=Sesamum angolense TaxID=2727404 RepID=A0AAE1WKA8_9LAMI|nr:hypothetical protein Sango_1644400 [Sesamum angolense]